MAGTPGVLLPGVLPPELGASCDGVIDRDVRRRVRLEDQVGNAEADTAADLGRRHQSDVLVGARRRLLKNS